MYAARRFRSNIGGNKFIPEYKINKLIVRKPVLRSDRMFPAAAKIFNEMIQEPLPLKYKLQALPSPDTTFNEPLGNTDNIPFQIVRTNNNNLPVYSDFVDGRQRQITIEFTNEVRKIVSNSKVEVKIGRVEIKGAHTQKVKLWLRRLGF